jgi:hypothetical protein
MWLRAPRAAGLAMVMVALGLGAASTAWARTALPERGDRSVHDAAGVIDDGVEQKMEMLHTELWQKARVAIVIVTVPRLEDETIEELAVRIGQSWGVGQKGKDEGVVVALSVEDRPSSRLIRRRGLFPGRRAESAPTRACPLRERSPRPASISARPGRRRRAQRHATGMPDLPPPPAAARGPAPLRHHLAPVPAGRFLAAGAAAAGRRRRRRRLRSRSAWQISAA